MNYYDDLLKSGEFLSIEFIKDNIDKFSEPVVIGYLDRESCEKIYGIEKIKNIFGKESFYKNHFSTDFLEKYHDCISWSFICVYCHNLVPDEMIRNNFNKIHLNGLYSKLDESFIDKFSDKLDWTRVCQSKHITESFVEKHFDYIDWATICSNMKLSEDFILKYKDKVYWNLLVSKRMISKDFFVKRKNEIVESLGNDEEVYDMMLSEIHE